MSRCATTSGFVPVRRPANRGRKTQLQPPGPGQGGCARLAQVALELLRSGDVRGAQVLLAQTVAEAPDMPRRWGAAWAARTLSRRSRRPIAAPQRGAAEPTAASAAQATTTFSQPAPIRICALGGFELTIDGVTFSSGVKPQRRPLDLLKVLLICNGHSLGAAELADKLWPDSDGDTARNSLQVAVHRLRRLLGREQAVIVQDRKICLDHALCTTDVWTFERTAQQLVHACGEGAAYAEHAVDTLRLYRGHLFAHEPDQAWMLAPRERLRRLWLTLVRHLGDYFEAHAQEERACELYQLTVDMDPLAEEVYRRLMRCQQKAGESAQAVHTYHCCREQLVSILGVAPSPETERLYHTLRSAA